MPFDLDKFNLQMFLHGAGNTYSVERARRGAAKFFRERQAPLELSAKDLQALADLLDPDKLWPGKAKKTKKNETGPSRRGHRGAVGCDVARTGRPPRVRGGS